MQGCFNKRRSFLGLTNKDVEGALRRIEYQRDDQLKSEFFVTGR
jgi:hypothetical protein